MVAEVNGVQVSEGDLSDMSWTFAQILQRAADGVTLEPGEVIGSGTVGTGCFLELNGSKATHNQWLKPGDSVSLTIDGLGTLTHDIVEDPSR
jgi:fumarylacetoacetate (FAA) hydrolase